MLAPEREWFSCAVLDVDAELAPQLIAVGLDEKTALVSVDLRLDEHQPVELRIEPLRHQPSDRPYWRS